jgi:hypothetical protein
MNINGLSLEKTSLSATSGGPIGKSASPFTKSGNSSATFGSLAGTGNSPIDKSETSFRKSAGHFSKRAVPFDSRTGLFT